MTCLLSKYPVKYVKKILQKIHKLGAGNRKKGDSHLLNGCPGIFNCNFYFYIGGIK